MTLDVALVDSHGATVLVAEINDVAPSADDENHRVLRVRGTSTSGAAPGAVVLTTRRRSGGALIDSLRLATFSVECVPPAAADATCFESLPFRVVIDLVDRDHPSFAGGAIVGGLLDELLVSSGAPSGDGVAPTPERRFEIRGSQATRGVAVRIVSVEIAEDGDAAIGDWGSIQREVERSQAIWSVCGVDVDGPPAQAGALAATPTPESFMLSVGCEAPAPALGGAFSFRAGARDLSISIDAGMSPRGAARRVATKLEALGLRATLVDNPRPQGAAAGSTDILVRDASGVPVALTSSPHRALSTDPALSLCVPDVDLSDGLRHFTDVDSLVGTMEERLLIHATADTNPHTIDVIVVPSFRGESRIGETFIGQGRGPLRNVLILDRAAFRVAHASYTMAHELGHIILDQPGHTDDFGHDTPTSLMDADAANPSAFGPRRLSPDECARSHRAREEDDVLTPRTIE